MNYCIYSSEAGILLFRNSERGIGININTRVLLLSVTYVGHFLNLSELHCEGTTPLQEAYFKSIGILKQILKELLDKIGKFTTIVGTIKNRLLD